MLAGFEADCLHSSRLFLTQRANEEVAENILVPIEFELDLVRENRRPGRARNVFWIQHSQQSLTAKGPKADAGRAVINGKPAMHTKASPDHVGTCATRRCFRKSRPGDAVVC